MKPLLSACLIVKNEEACLARCLRSIAGVADEIIVVDTGSTDDTVAIAERHGARLFTFPWTNDYAAARNVSLGHATGRFILYIDADEELVDGAPLCELLASDTTDAVEMSIVSQLPRDMTSVSRYLRVFRNYPGVHFVNPIHEQIWPALAAHQPRVHRSQLRIVHHGYNQEEVVLAGKRQRNLDGALAILETDPDNPFYLYHAGIGYLTLGEPERAIPWLERAERLSAAAERPMVLNALAQASFDLQRHQDAERQLRESVAAEPAQRHGWALLADVLLLGQRHQDAIQALRAVLAVKQSALHTDVTPNRAVLQMKLGMCELLTHEPAAAIDSLSRALDASTLNATDRATAERYRGMAQRMLR